MNKIFLLFLLYMKIHTSDIVAASAVSQLVILECLLSLTNSRKHALTTNLSSSHSYNNYNYLLVKGFVSA